MHCILLGVSYDDTVEPRYKDTRHKDNRTSKDIFQGPNFFVCEIRQSFGRGRGRGPAKIMYPIVELDWVF